MSEIYRFLFSLFTDPLGLPVNVLDEYIILAFIEIIARQLAYNLVGWIHYLDRDEARALYWIFSCVFYVAVWGLARLVIFLLKLFGLII